MSIPNLMELCIVLNLYITVDSYDGAKNLDFRAMWLCNILDGVFILHLIKYCVLKVAGNNF